MSEDLGPLQQVDNYEKGPVSERLAQMTEKYWGQFPKGFAFVVRVDGAIHMLPIDRVGIVEWRPEVLPE